MELIDIAYAPADMMARAYLYGGLQGTWAVNWIVLWGLTIYNTLVVTGECDLLRDEGEVVQLVTTR